jgi:hypothetical protein
MKRFSTFVAANDFEITVSKLDKYLVFNHKAVGGPYYYIKI